MSVQRHPIGNRLWSSGALARSLKPEACVSMSARVTRVGPEVKHGRCRRLEKSGHVETNPFQFGLPIKLPEAKTKD